MNKKSFVQLLLPFLGVLLAIIVMILPVASAYSGDFSSIHIVTNPAYAYIFGGTVTAKGSSVDFTKTMQVNLFRASPIALASWILLLLGLLCGVSAIVVRFVKTNNDAFVSLLAVSAVLMIAGGITAFCVMDSLVVCEVQNGSSATPEAIKSWKESNNVKLGFGFVGTGVFALISGLVLGAGATILRLKKD